tara:strand:- start:521 stop:724 length:204 start_codon:yes stop_codon:yes gene_type:complete
MSLNNNDRVLLLIKERIEHGQREYKQHIPMDGEKGRDNLKEALEEALDLSIYLAAKILSLKENNNAQ